MKKPAGYQPLKLSDVSSPRGAPMGRGCSHMTGLTKPQFQLERMPLVDGDYDCGGAYWGGPGPLWCADFTTPLTQTTLVHFYVRAADREAAMDEVREVYPDAEFLPETGSIIEQTIRFLNEYLSREMENEDTGDTEDEIADLDDQLANIRRK